MIENITIGPDGGDLGTSDPWEAILVLAAERRQLREERDAARSAIAAADAANGTLRARVQELQEQLARAVDPTAQDYDNAAEILRLRELVAEILADYAKHAIYDHTPALTAQFAEWRQRAGLEPPAAASPEGRAAYTRLVSAHFVGNGPHPLQLVCTTEDASDVECDQTITEIESGVTWDEVEALIAAHAAECHAPRKPGAPAIRDVALPAASTERTAP